MEDTRDKRPVYMSTFQKRTDKIKSQMKSEIDIIEDKIDDKIAQIDKRIRLFFIVSLVIVFIVIAVSYYHYA